MPVQITPEQVKYLQQRACLSYEDAKEVMERAGGDLLRALIILEEGGKITFSPPARETSSETLLSWFWEINKAARIRIKGPEGALFQLPLALGLAGAAAFPRLTSWSMLLLLLTHCSLELDVH